MSETTLIQTMQILGVEHDDAQDRVKMTRVQDIANFFGQYADGMDRVQRVAVKIPKAERVDALHEYMTMRREHDTLETEVKDMEPLFTGKKERLKSIKRTLERIE